VVLARVPKRRARVSQVTLINKVNKSTSKSNKARTRRAAFLPPHPTFRLRPRRRLTSSTFHHHYYHLTSTLTMSGRGKGGKVRYT
jgi:hypothetical protein